MNKEFKRRMREMPLEELEKELHDAQKELIRAEIESRRGSRRMAYGGARGIKSNKYDLKRIRKKIALIKTIGAFLLLLLISGCVSVTIDDIDGIEIDKECTKTLYNLYMSGNITDDDISNCRIYLIKNDSN